MKNTQLTQLIREVIEETLNTDSHGQLSGGHTSSPMQASVGRVGANNHHSNKITASERRKLSNAFHKYPELEGNKKVESLGQGLSVIHMCLDDLGFELDMVTGDMLLGQSGSRNFTYRRKDPTGMSKEIENSRIVFTWTNLGDEFNKRYEIVAYPS